MDAHVRSTTGPLGAGKHRVGAVGDSWLVARPRLESNWILRPLDHLRRGAPTDRFARPGLISRFAPEAKLNGCFVVIRPGRFVVCTGTDGHPGFVGWVYRLSGVAPATQRYSAYTPDRRTLRHTPGFGGTAISTTP